MFERIAVDRDHCGWCGEYGPVAVLYGVGDLAGHGVVGCEKCIRAAGKAAELLRVPRQAKASKGKATPKKARKPPVGQPEPVTAYRRPGEHEVGSLIPAAADRS